MDVKVRLNKNSIPFLILVVFQLFFVCLLKKRKLKNTWTLLFANIGMAFLFEYVVLNLFQAYTYKPKLLKKRYFDNILGAILSQAIYIPVSSTFITIFKKDWKWKIGFSIYFYCIERLFIWLKIYEIKWWKPVYTFFLLPTYYVMSDFFFKGLNQQKMIVKKLAHYLTIMVIDTIFMYILAYKQVIRFKIRKFDSVRVHFMIAPLYSIIMSIISTFLGKRNGVYSRIFHLCIYHLFDAILKNCRILFFNRRQYKWTIVWHIFMVCTSRFVYRRIFQHNNHD